MRRNLAPKEIFDLSDEALNENLNQFENFDSESIILLYAENQDREIPLSPDMLFKLLDYSSAAGWEDINLEVLNYVTQKGHSSYSAFKQNLMLPIIETAPVNTEIHENPFIPIPEVVNQPKVDFERTNVSNNQVSEIAEAISSAGENLGKVFGSLIGQICSFVGFCLVVAMIQEIVRGRSSREDGIAIITVIYLIFMAFFTIRMLVFLNRTSAKMRNVKITQSK